VSRTDAQSAAGCRFHGCPLVVESHTTEAHVQYMLLIYHDEERWNEDWEAMSEEERRAFLGEYFALDDEARRAGALVSGEALQRTASATTVRVRDGEQLVTDGPFA
jgi:hypothetical protein